ncbi:PREDICTED: putative dual specificity protein phosphatase DSP8 [Tarenaya hassleriana]|uniref:putative dual specificity protein phosphatase DSP8 n=1 Tax=Tarenaya hassleriana TaxID=28532 RepID=UPI00053C5187|nr:PREDICTED: putative dual specificity protein phosphatase DSP8 [Tarenaya hassleriana]XP_010538407.1 PREDICTED: putative dual specificity protein phosphatase DSP8 [Tarenaya hassleriana]
MYIEELKEREEEKGEMLVGVDEEGNRVVGGDEGALLSRESVVVLSTKRVLVGVGARALFYPTLVYNVVRNKLEAEFRWWDRVAEFILLGAVPFPSDVPRLKELGVCGVITLNEQYETLVPSSLYKSHCIDHLVIPTRDYCFAPSMEAIAQAVDFIHRNALVGKTTYVHCKAGRGRSTTIVICYLVHHKHMTPEAAYAYVRSIRPRVLLAASQWKAVLEYYCLEVPKSRKPFVEEAAAAMIPRSVKPVPRDVMVFDDGTVVVVTKSDLEGFDPKTASASGNEIWAEAGLGLVYGVKVAGQAALARISYLWLRCRTDQKISGERLSIESGSLGGVSLDISVY